MCICVCVCIYIYIYTHNKETYKRFRKRSIRKDACIANVFSRRCLSPDAASPCISREGFQAWLRAARLPAVRKTTNSHMRLSSNAASEDLSGQTSRGIPYAPWDFTSRQEDLKIHQRGVQWKQGVVIYMLLYTSLLYNTTPIHAPRSHCTPL